MNDFRRTTAWNRRDAANQMANQRPHPRHISNGDEQKFRHKEDSDATNHHHTEHEKHLADHPDSKCGITLNLNHKPAYLMSFTKGMPHNTITGLLQDPQHFQYFIRATDSGHPGDFRDTPLGPEAHVGEAYNCRPPADKWFSKKAKEGADGKAVNLRAWESQSAGLAYDLEGPDAQAVTMPPHPILGSAELTAEMGEVYVQALLRDTPFNAMSAGIICNGDINTDLTFDSHADVQKVMGYTNKLNNLEWFEKDACELCLEQPARSRHRGSKLNPGNAFRGITKGDNIGPYLSQFLLIGDSGIGFSIDTATGDKIPERNASKGLISYGAINVEQKVRVAIAGKDYMTTWEEWLDVQQAANVGGQEAYVLGSNTTARRFMYTPRDLATYVHFDALYEAYLNACLILLSNKTPFDPGIPFQEDDTRDHQQGFAHFGGPHILSLVTEVATRALKAVRYQKYNIHRRCRPEVLAARLTKANLLGDMAPELNVMVHELGGILPDIESHNSTINTAEQKTDDLLSDPNYLLPMAFCEGSPMHPAYGAGHATVAGACTTVLKAFFDCQHLFKPNGKDANQAYVAVNNPQTHKVNLQLTPVLDQHCKEAHLTVEGELNKLASNISIGRNWAGVHYFTDYYESLLMGEQIAIAILEEQKLMFGENFSMTIPLFGGNAHSI